MGALSPLFPNLEEAEKEKLRKQNASGEYIQRTEDEVNYSVESPEPKDREKYPWENNEAPLPVTITPEVFRCRGSQKKNAPTDKNLRSDYLKDDQQIILRNKERKRAQNCALTAARVY